MKNTIVKLLALASVVASSQAAVTYTFLNYTGSALGPNGLPFVDSAGASILNSSNSLFASIGYLTAGGDNTAASVLSRFNPVDNTPLSPITSPTNRNGLFNGQDYNSAANVDVPGFLGQTPVVLIGNSANILSSTAIAAFQFTGTYTAVNPVTGAAQSFALTSASTPLVGTLRTVTTQPNTPGASPFVNGVQLVAIPETSTSLLGAIGALALLRRRRN
jgi:hypothetical protein